MKSGRKPTVLAMALIGAGMLILLLPLLAAAANFLQNDALEPPFVKYGEWSTGGVTFDLEVAHDWERFFVAEGTEDDGEKLRYFRSSAVEFLFGFVEKRDGEDAQLWWSTKPFDAGIYQQVSGLTIGESYGFQAGILQVYANTTSQIDNKMFRSVGIDPYGGVDPTGPNVIWSPEEGEDVDWFYPGVGAQAISSTVTVFIRVRSPEDSPQFEENSVWADDTFMDLAPATTLTLTVDSPTQVTAAWNGLPRPGFHLFAYEAQYRQSSNPEWTDLQIFTSDEDTAPPSTSPGQSFTVQPGLEYVVRARTWHEEDGGDSHEVPGPWVEQTIRAGGMVSGRTLDNRENPFSQVTVTISGTPTTTLSSETGQYDLVTGPGLFGLTADEPSGWTTSYPVNVTVPTLQAVVPLTLTLRPPDDVITNGDFEDGPDGLAGWQTDGSPPERLSSGHRSGDFSLILTGTATLSQIASLSGSFEPTLSFWYKIAGGDGNDLFTAQILGTPALTAANSFSTTVSGGWRHAWLPLALSEVYTGPVGVRFSLNQSGPTPGVVYLDEVSLGGSRGGASETYLPLVLK